MNSKEKEISSFNDRKIFIENKTLKIIKNKNIKIKNENFVNEKSNLSVNTSKKSFVDRFSKNNEEYPEKIAINFLAKKSFFSKEFIFSNKLISHKPENNKYLDFLVKNINKYLNNNIEYIDELIENALSNIGNKEDPYKIDKAYRIKGIFKLIGLKDFMNYDLYHLKLLNIKGWQYNSISEEVRIICKIENKLLEIYTFDLYHLLVIGNEGPKEKKYIDKFKKVKKYRVDLNNFFSFFEN